jgi:hypothetical protein
MPGSSGFGLSVMGFCVNIDELAVLIGMEEMLVFGVWPLTELAGMPEDVVVVDPRSTLGGKRPPLEVG